MKCIMSVDEKHIKRVTDKKASELYQDGGWRYIPKSLWKEQVRDVDKPTEEPTKKKNNKMSKSAKRHLRNANK